VLLIIGQPIINWTITTWSKKEKKWKAEITIDGKYKFLGCFHDEKEAACKYDEQATLLNKPVNFPEHEQDLDISARRF
jgi:hypothetical protein